MHMIMDIISFIRSWLPNANQTRKRSASEDFDIPNLAKIPRLNISSMSSIEDEWLSNSSSSFPKIRRSFLERPDMTRKPIFKSSAPILIDDDDIDRNRRKIHVSSTPNTSKNKENGLDDFSFKIGDPIKKRYKEEYLNPNPSLFSSIRSRPSIKFPLLNNIKRLTPTTKRTNYGSTGAEFTFRLDDKKKYEELLSNSQGGLNAVDFSSFAEYSTPMGKISPMTRTQRMLHMACKTSKSEVLDLTNGDTPKPKSRLSTKDKIIKVLDKLDSDVIVVKDNDSDIEILPTPPSPKSDFAVRRVNSLKTVVHPSEPQHESWIINKIKQHEEAIAKREREIVETSATLLEFREIKQEVRTKQLAEQVKKVLHIKEIVLPEELEEKLPDLTAEQEDIVDNAIDKQRSLNAVLSSKFRLNITRRDMLTLSGLNWLNDEIINFYMNLIIERGKNSKFPKTYAFNTFFYPKILKDGHTSVSRWTKKIDIFSYDLICVPIHMSMHWCMAIVDFRVKTVTYYDSMGKPNHQCIEALARYLQEEHLSKMKSDLNLADWKLKCLKDIPQQMNGSDCGVFSCTYAEFLSRNAQLNFSQKDMPYLRRKMVVEIIRGELLI